jgi:hypothetical protein
VNKRGRERLPVKHHQELGHVCLARYAQHCVHEAEVSELSDEVHARHTALWNNVLRRSCDASNHASHVEASENLSQVAPHLEAKDEQIVVASAAGVVQKRCRVFGGGYLTQRVTQVAD